MVDNNGGLNFVHPIYFVDHLRKASAIDENHKYNKAITLDDYRKPSDGSRVSQKIVYAKDNPGFMPDGQFSWTQWFNEKPYSSDYRHEGVDMAVDHTLSGMVPIKALIRGKVVWSHDYLNDHYGRCIIIQANQKYKGLYRYYLLAHLERKDSIPEVNSIIVPNQIVGYIGNTGHCVSNWQWDNDEKKFDYVAKSITLINEDHIKSREHGAGAHLHLQLFLSEKKDSHFLDLVVKTNMNLETNDVGIVNAFDYLDIYWDDRS
ncbi:M23 family metallopeptidase [Spirochaeta cellobiosiphila]|uniref:M23 family metallopeptidase n=1 Tax=Spirochaeta cellobiosiphila TaxID=504483 RepID=UPI00041646E1|nr:M23 family metallopeptidase [Spirochaeta cellobiosiphila]